MKETHDLAHSILLMDDAVRITIGSGALAAAGTISQRVEVLQGTGAPRLKRLSALLAEFLTTEYIDADASSSAARQQQQVDAQQARQKKEDTEAKEVSILQAQGGGGGRGAGGGKASGFSAFMMDSSSSDDDDDDEDNDGSGGGDSNDGSDNDGDEGSGKGGGEGGGGDDAAGDGDGKGEGKLGASGSDLSSSSSSSSSSSTPHVVGPRIIVFTVFKKEASEIARALVLRGFPAVALQGNMSQRARTIALDRWERKRLYYGVTVVVRYLEMQYSENVQGMYLEYRF